MSDARPGHRRRNLISLLLQCGLLALLCAVVAAGWQLYQHGQATVVDGAALEQVRTSAADPGKEQPVAEAPSPVADPGPQSMPAAPHPAIEDKPSSEVPEVRSAAAESPATESPEAGISQNLIHGTWQDNYQGKRTMTLRPDGTGTMVVELKGWNATLFAARLTFEMEWSIDGDRLHKRTIGGEPAGKVRAVLAMMGDQVEEQIIELTDQRLLVSDGEREYDWRRATE